MTDTEKAELAQLDAAIAMHDAQAKAARAKRRALLARVRMRRGS